MRHHPSPLVATLLRALAPAVLLSAVLGACSSDEPDTRASPPPPRRSMRSSGKVSLPAGASVEGRAIVPAGASASIRLTNNGPGHVNYVLRSAGGAEISSGTLTSFTTDLGTAVQTTTYVLLLRAEGAAEVVGTATINGGVGDISWEVPR